MFRLRLSLAFAVLVALVCWQAGGVYWGAKRVDDFTRHSRLTGDILAELPFDNRVVAIDISGATLRLAIENGLSQLPKPAGRFPQVSGLAIEADPSRPPGSRVLSMKIDGEPLDDNRIYRVAINDYMLRGGDDYTMFRDAPEVLEAADAPQLSTDVMEYIEQIGTIRTEVGDRLVLK